MLTADARLGQVARVSDCANCGHCVELYTPKDSDPVEVQVIREEIRQWIALKLSESAMSEEKQYFFSH